MEDKTRLIIDFDNDEELKEFYNLNRKDLKKLEYSEARSNSELKTYKTEFEKDVRKQT